MSFQTKKPLIEFYKARIAYFYGGNVEMADFASIDEVIRRETNRRVAMKTDNVVRDFMHHDHPTPEAPMALYAANYFKVVEIIEMILLPFKFYFFPGLVFPPVLRLIRNELHQPAPRPAPRVRSGGLPKGEFERLLPPRDGPHRRRASPRRQRQRSQPNPHPARETGRLRRWWSWPARGQNQSGTMFCSML